MRLVISVLLLSLATAAHAGVTWGERLPAALAAAEQRRTLVLVDFYAPWCYSCYFMDENVLSQPAMAVHARGLELVKLDVDAPAGNQAREDYAIKFLPTYLVLDAQGREVGRIAGEHTPDAFFSQLNAITRRAAPVEALIDRFATAPDALKPGLAADILGAYVDQQNAAAAEYWWQSLPADQRARLTDDPAVARERARMRLRQADTPAACRAVAPALLDAPLGCVLPYEVRTLNECLQQTPSPELLARQAALLEGFVEQRLHGQDTPADQQCADQRTGVQVLHSVYQQQGRDAAAAQLLARTIARLQAALPQDLSADRWRADNLRVFLHMAEDAAGLRALYPRLIAAFDQDYVYPYRFGRWLIEQGQPAAALDALEQAADRAYGVNRLRIAGYRADALVALNRPADALAVIDTVLATNRRFFPDEAQALRDKRAAIAATAGTA